MNWPAWSAVLDFLSKNKVAGFVFGGDQFNNDAISRHTKGKPLLRSVGEYKRDEKTFTTKILEPLETLLGDARKIWIEGNHDDWENQLVQEQPELDGIQRKHSLTLEDRGWEFIPCGQRFKHKKLTFVHGETLSGFGNQGSVMHSRKAVDTYCGSVVYGHMHSPQSFTKVLPYDETEKWMAYCAPTMGTVNPGYLRNRPTAWLTGIVLVEFQPNGNFNVYPSIISGGSFAFGGKIYEGKKKK